MYASEKLELSSRALIKGNVHYNVLEMASGAAVNGNMLHDKRDKKLLEHQSSPRKPAEPAVNDAAMVKS